MKSFDFFLPTKISLGNGVFNETGKYLKETVSGNRILIVTDPGIEQAGFLDKLLSIQRKTMKLRFSTRLDRIQGIQIV